MALRVSPCCKPRPSLGRKRAYPLPAPTQGAGALPRPLPLTSTEATKVTRVAHATQKPSYYALHLLDIHAYPPFVTHVDQHEGDEEGRGHGDGLAQGGHDGAGGAGPHLELRGRERGGRQWAGLACDVMYFRQRTILLVVAVGTMELWPLAAGGKTKTTGTPRVRNCCRRLAKIGLWPTHLLIHVGVLLMT